MSKKKQSRRQCRAIAGHTYLARIDDMAGYYPVNGVNVGYTCVMHCAKFHNDIFMCAYQGDCPLASGDPKFVWRFPRKSIYLLKDVTEELGRDDDWGKHNFEHSSVKTWVSAEGGRNEI